LNSRHPDADIFKSIVDAIYNGVVVIDKVGKIVLFNAAAERITGFKVEEVLTRHITDVVPNTGLIRVLSTGQAEVSEKIVVNGRTCITHRAPIFHGSEIWGAVGVFHDISSLDKTAKELESNAYLLTELKKLTNELELIIESSNDGLYITDGKGVTLRVNSTYEEVTGIKANEVVGHHMKELVDKGFFSESVTLHVLSQSTPQAVTRLQRLRNGRYVISTGQPVFDEAGNIYRVVTNVRDVTHFLNLQKELEKLKTDVERYKQEAEQLRSEYLKQEDMIANSKQILHVLEMIKQVAPYPTTVLVTGESGVGKEIAARLLHVHGSHREGPFIKVNCGAIPENLLESELFGYEAGAFTGANKKGKPGMLELADSGSLFLDEIGELAFDLQVKLLQVIQDQEVTRLGGTSSRKISIRFITATNKNLLGPLLPP
jgi:PAS domain S-box-containing protein